MVYDGIVHNSSKIADFVSLHFRTKIVAIGASCDCVRREGLESFVKSGGERRQDDSLRRRQIFYVKNH